MRVRKTDKLLEDGNVRRWFENVRRGSLISSEIMLRSSEVIVGSMIYMRTFVSYACPCSNFLLVVFNFVFQWMVCFAAKHYITTQILTFELFHGLNLPKTAFKFFCFRKIRFDLHRAGHTFCVQLVQTFC